MGGIGIRRSAGIPKRGPEARWLPVGEVQAGLEPLDWKPFDDVGAGAKEIRIKDASGIYGVMYVASNLCPALLPEKDSGNQQTGTRLLR